MKREKKQKKDFTKSGLQPALNSSSVRVYRTLLRRKILTISLLLCGTFVTGMTLAVVSVSLQSINVAKTMRVQGILQAIEQSTPVSHPDGGVINQVFVTEGEVVREGQILASLNTEDLAENLHIARQLVAGFILRSQCLRAMKKNQPTLTLSEDLKQIMGRLQQISEMNRSQLHCQDSLRIRTLELAASLNQLRTAGDLARTNTRIMETNILLHQKFKLLNEIDATSLNEVTELVEMRDILIQSIESKKLSQDFKNDQADFEMREIKRLSKIDEELRYISDRLVEARAELTAMEFLLKNKFIYASTSGRIQRMRIEKEGLRIAAGAYVMEISPLATDFEVSSRINTADFPSLAVGQPVQIKLSAGLPKPIWVPAEIAEITKISNNKRLIRIRLAREDLNKRDLLLGDNSLNGLGERSEAIISINSESALKTLETALKKIVKPKSYFEQLEI